LGLPNDIAVLFAGHAAGQRSGTPRDARSTTTRAARAFETRVHATQPVVPRRGRLYLQPRSPDEHGGVSISSSSTETGKRRRMRAKRPVQGKRLFFGATTSRTSPPRWSQTPSATPILPSTVVPRLPRISPRRKKPARAVPPAFRHVRQSQISR